MKKVLIVGPSTKRTRGGMATVISRILEKQPKKVFVVKHLITHVEGSAGEKISNFIRSLYQFLWKEKYDLIHVHVASGASFYRKSFFVLFASLKTKPVLLHVHSGRISSFYFNSGILCRTYIKYVIKLCDKIIVVNDITKKFIMENMEARSIEILQNGVDTESFKHCSTSEKKINNFIFLGRIRREKGIYDLLSAIDIIVNKRCIKDLCFYIAGDGEIESVKAFVNQHHLQNNVEVLGWLDDKEKIECLKKGETVILPSYSEGLPISILEGMAAGKIIISTNIGSIPALVKNGENGFLINPGDINKLVDCIVGIIDQKILVERFSINNINKIRKFYDISQFDERLSIMYEELLK